MIGCVLLLSKIATQNLTTEGYLGMHHDLSSSKLVDLFFYSKPVVSPSKVIDMFLCILNYAISLWVDAGVEMGRHHNLDADAGGGKVGHAHLQAFNSKAGEATQCTLSLCCRSGMGVMELLGSSTPMVTTWML